LGAEIAGSTGEFSIRRHAKLARQVDCPARAFGLDHMRIAARWSNGWRIQEAMNGHGYLPLVEFFELNRV
jgi:hypothetical protein